MYILHPGFDKEINKSRRDRLLPRRVQIKICQRCFLCHPIVFCKTCKKCRKCCLKSACRGQTSKLLAGSGCRSESSSNSERGLHPPLSNPTKLDKVPDRHKLVCLSSQEPLPVCIASAYEQTSSKSKVSWLHQPIFLGSETQKQMETNTRPEQSKPVPQGAKIQNGDTGDHQNLPPTRGVGYLNKFQGCLLPYTGHMIISSRHCHLECP